MRCRAIEKLQIDVGSPVKEPSETLAQSLRRHPRCRRNPGRKLGYTGSYRYTSKRSSRTSSTSTATSSNTDNTHYNVEKIIGKRRQGEIVQYKVHWKGYTMDECTWEPEYNLNCRELLREFENAHKCVKFDPNLTKRYDDRKKIREEQPRDTRSRRKRLRLVAD